MNPPVVIVGIGEMGGVFARGFLKAGHPVYPATRDVPVSKAAELITEPALVLIAVAEADLHPVLETVPETWRDRLTLLQNELLPRDWQRHGLNPTVIPVWFEKKKGHDAKVILPSPVYGPHAGLIAGALKATHIPTWIMEDEDELLFELVRKNLYILTTNIAGLKVGGTVGELLEHHQVFMHEVAHDILAIQEYLSGEDLPWERLIEAMIEAFASDPNHKSMGRSAPVRLERAIRHADAAGLEIPALRAVKAGLDR